MCCNNALNVAENVIVIYKHSYVVEQAELLCVEHAAPLAEAGAR